MVDNMKPHLLPHITQKIALLIILFVLILFFTVAISDATNGTQIGHWFDSLCVIVLYVAILCCLFSCEKIEDECISSLRLRSIAIVSLIGLLLVIVLNVIQVILPFDKYQIVKEWRKEYFWNGCFLIDLAVLYFILFKISVISIRKKK